MRIDRTPESGDPQIDGTISGCLHNSVPVSSLFVKSKRTSEAIDMPLNVKQPSGREQQ